MLSKYRLFIAITVSSILNLSCLTSVMAANIEDLVKPCADCHGKDGASTHPDTPIIGGFSTPYATDSMIAYKEKERPCPEAEYQIGDKKGKKTTMCPYPQATVPQLPATGPTVFK